MSGWAIGYSRVMGVIAHIACAFRRTDGAVSTEYALLAGLIALVIIGAVAALGHATLGLFEPVMNGF